MSTVVRVEKKKDYTVMSNYHLRDMSISLKAKGLLSQILSLPESWDYTIEGLAYINMENENAIRTAIWELEKAEYITRKRLRDERGRLTVAEYTIHEAPEAAVEALKKQKKESQFAAAPAQEIPTEENPILENPTLEKPTYENPVQLNTNRINKDLLNKDLIKYPSINQDGMDEMESREGYQAIVCENIELKAMAIDGQYDMDCVNEIAELMVDTICSENSTIRINGADVPQIVVKSRFLKIQRKHIEYVLDSMRAHPTQIRNIRSYLLTALYNAPTSIDNHYSALVNFNSA